MIKIGLLLECVTARGKADGIKQKFVEAKPQKFGVAKHLKDIIVL
jgi:hypothetical protein